jgi:hypothetical protein
MRIWSLHPKYLDTKGLLACWRETLLAKAVLNGNTRGYQNHPQLARFKLNNDPLNAINAYLAEIWNESDRRGYFFDKTKIDWNYEPVLIQVNDGQIAYELQHLLKKLETRDPAKYKLLKNLQKAEVHPVFKIVTGGIESWEKITG